MVELSAHGRVSADSQPSKGQTATKLLEIFLPMLLGITIRLTSNWYDDALGTSYLPLLVVPISWTLVT